MIYSNNKNWLMCLILMIYCGLSFGQTKSKPDLYLYFKQDLSKKVYKSDLNLQTKPANQNGQPSSEVQSIYHYAYLTDDGKKEYSYELLATIPGTHPLICNREIFSKYKIVPFQNLEKIKGLIADGWDSSKFPYRRIFVVEKIAKTRYKVVQVQLFFPFSSEGVKIRQLKVN
ncbi:hypothetical protein [Pedobacter rhodius]|uniref:Uncharacterized protein n=1 Tax=Pedobacter rhodius TaxID=3004098 RepID=A0ABT4KVF2_9SPHI|nr:hypothetical protein [Pedobacter sp. SJ11]MCZ4222909.1 hypothetical protein [Pedobacter sp. SJ11]